MIRQLAHRAWLWLRVLFTGRMGLAEAMDNVKNVTKPYNPRAGRMFWDHRLGPYRRTKPKVGRNQPCPCGAMRTAPGHVELPRKAKHCCYG